ncbi:NAD(P)/FAD-dependent oxidoreductase [Pedobacter gandavensis]|uniref:FAD-dependent oxidoreductase n=1 Tax=Pedobacter gandavensis TaxID=2679963 RepID=A0ABR6EYB0_9SPHI|nr:FAD-binding oxidoreductase [Pedobacter gandavensis]MBB2150255.1 FAD-dependent oxidoreductase [Pedobacter gandavensis]
MNIRSNEPFWLVKNGLLYTYPSLRENTICEVLIVGAGITGALMAHSMIKQGYDTVLIDKREIAHGSSSATTSMLQYEIDVSLVELTEMIGAQGAIASYRACKDAIYKLKELVDEIESSCGFERKDSLYFAGRRKDISWLKAEFDARKTAGFGVEWLEKKEIKERYGIAAEGGILSEDGGSVDAFCLTHDLLHYNAKKGLRVFDKTALKRIKYRKDSVQVELESGIQITAGKVIYCTGYETQAMLPEKIVSLKSTYAMVSEKDHTLSPELETTLFWNTDTPYLYMRTTTDGRLLVGGEDENFKNPGLRDALLGRKRAKLLKTLKQYLPDHQFIDDFCWCGTFGETKDGLPYIGAHPKFPNSYFVLGFGGNGITFSIAGMDIIPEMMRGTPGLLSHYFRFGR